MPGNNAQQACRDSAYFPAWPAADQRLFTLCIPADYYANGELAINAAIQRCRRQSCRSCGLDTSNSSSIGGRHFRNALLDAVYRPSQTAPLPRSSGD